MICFLCLDMLTCAYTNACMRCLHYFQLLSSKRLHFLSSRIILKDFHVCSSVLDPFTCTSRGRSSYFCILVLTRTPIRPQENQASDAHSLDPLMEHLSQFRSSDDLALTIRNIYERFVGTRGLKNHQGTQS